MILSQTQQNSAGIMSDIVLLPSKVLLPSFGAHYDNRHLREPAPGARESNHGLPNPSPKVFGRTSTCLSFSISPVHRRRLCRIICAGLDFLLGLFLSGQGQLQAAPAVLDPNLQIRLVMNTTNSSGANSIRIAK